MKISEVLLSGIIFLPVTGICLLLLWRNASKTQAAIIAMISEGFALVIPIILLTQLQAGFPVVFSVPWIGSMGISFSLELNWLSLIFLLTEVLVTLVAMVYSLGEKTGEKSSNHYYALLLLFS